MQAVQIGRWTAASTAAALPRRVLREGGAKGRHLADRSAMIVGRELGRLRMRLATVKHVRDGLALIRGQRGDKTRALTCRCASAAITAPA